ncbi:ParM/StbA family protein [Alicyclobacillus shizuokensis]|uniref:ParM/StbA family protein n=1 Tax=Alicyclobacillus shizuokensis TaxID=392014 RepID=UPI000831E7EC|nr:ParM/StbA family protein [Alicyclobacillus shizuokensis]
MSKTAAKAASTPKATTVPYLVAPDIGFGVVKVLSSAPNVRDSSIVMPATAAPGVQSTSRLFNLNHIDRKKLIVTTSEGTYFVGENANTKTEGRSNRTQESDRANDPISRILFKTGIALGVPDEEGEYDVFVVTGLPNRDYDSVVKENLEKFLSEPYEITFHLGGKDITKKINFVGCVILRQPEGSILNNTFSFTPDYKETGSLLAYNPSIKEFVGIIDIGHFTTDYALFQDGFLVPSDKTCGSSEAAHLVYSRLRVELMSKFRNEYGMRYEPTDKDLDRAVRQRKVQFNGVDHDVTAEVDACVQEVAATIAKDVFEAWGPEATRLDQILLTGGGAHLFEEALANEFAARKIQPFTIIPNPQFGNTVGYYMFGAMELAGRYDIDQVYQEVVAHLFAD